MQGGYNVFHLLTTSIINNKVICSLISPYQHGKKSPESFAHLSTSLLLIHSQMQSLFLSQWSNNVDKLMHIEQITQNNLLFCLHMHKWCKES